MKKPRTKLVRVTAADIKKGKPNDTASCPIALAMRRSFKVPPKHVCVGDWLIIGDSYAPLLDIEAPDVCARFMARFDEGKPVKPFSFRVPA